MDKNSICVVGNAKPPKDTPIANRFTFFFISFIADGSTGEILDAEVSTLLKLTNDFVKTLFIGKSLASVDNALMDEVKNRYLGSSQRAIQVAYKDAVIRYNSWKNNNSQHQSEPDARQ